MTKNETIVIIDRSGSMQPIAAETVAGYNRFIDDQRKDPGETRITLVQFDNVIETVFQAVPADKAMKMYIGNRALASIDPSAFVTGTHEHPFVPRGSTSLNDAIGKTLNEQGKRIHDEQWTDSVTLCIVTDGYENSSTEFSTDQIKTMITHAEKNGWRVIYLGANQDAFAVAQSYGISQSSTATYSANAVGTRSAWATASGMSSMLKQDPNAKVDMTALYEKNLKEGTAP